MDRLKRTDLEQYSRWELIALVRDLEEKIRRQEKRIAEWDRLLRASVPERWKNCTSPVGSVQSYIAELEYDIRDQDRRISIYLSKSDCRKVKHIAKLEALVRRAARDSVVTTADDPGCFYCDRSGPHAPDCPAGAALDEERDRGR